MRRASAAAASDARSCCRACAWLAGDPGFFTGSCVPGRYSSLQHTANRDTSLLAPGRPWLPLGHGHGHPPLRTLELLFTARLGAAALEAEPLRLLFP